MVGVTARLMATTVPSTYLLIRSSLLDVRKIADMSIVSVNVSANTCNTALAIGEKAADILIDELGLGKRHDP